MSVCWWFLKRSRDAAGVMIVLEFPALSCQRSARVYEEPPSPSLRAVIQIFCPSLTTVYRNQTSKSKNLMASPCFDRRPNCYKQPSKTSGGANNTYRDITALEILHPKNHQHTHQKLALTYTEYAPPPFISSPVRDPLLMLHMQTCVPGRRSCARGTGGNARKY